MAKSQAFKTLGQANCLEISSNKQLIIAGGRQTLKVVSIRPENDYWFETKKNINKLKGPKGEIKQLALACLSCSKSNKLAISTNGSQNSIYIYDLTDFNSTRYEQSFDRLFGSQLSKKIQWGPGDNILTALCDELLVQLDVRTEQIAARLEPIQGENISEFKYSHLDSNLIAFTTDTEKINIYDFRNLSQPVAYQDNFRTSEPRTIPIEWSPDGSKLANGFESKIKIWDINGNKLTLYDSIPCAEQIKKMKWLQKSGEYHFLVSQKKPARLCKYDLEDPNKYIGEYLVTAADDFRSYQLNDWAIDNDEQLIVATYAQVNSPKQSTVSAQFSQNMLDSWSGKYNYPVQFDFNNRLIFPTKKWHKKKIVHSSAVLMTEREESSIAINDHLYFEEFSRSQLIADQLQLERKQYLQQQKRQTKQLSRRVTQKLAHKQQSIKSLDKYDPTLQKSKTRDRKLSRQDSQIKIQKHKSGDNRSVKKSMRSLSQFSDNLQEEENPIFPKRYLLSKKDEFVYLMKNYKLDANNSNLMAIIQHNSEVACRLGKNLCMEFWGLLFSYVLPHQNQEFSIEDIYQSETKCEISINNNKIIAVCEEEPSDLKKKQQQQEHVVKLIQKLVDQNQLQTAVLGASVLRKFRPNILQQKFFYKILAEYKVMLRILGFHTNSIQLSHYIGMQEFDPGYNLHYPTKIYCAFCGKKLVKCTCGVLCIFCGKNMKDGFITVCKICGHAGHTKEYKDWFVTNKNTKCPYQCGHQCFNQRSFEMKLKKIDLKDYYET